MKAATRPCTPRAKGGIQFKISSFVIAFIDCKRYYFFAKYFYCHSRAGGNPETQTMEKQFYVYILASKRNGTLYVGVTSDLAQRIWQHKTDAAPGFSSKYGVHRLVYYEEQPDAERAIFREKQIAGAISSADDSRSLALRRLCSHSRIYCWAI